ncbi:MAG: chemotaxis protein, partial [Burkholderiaceae bacterium]|nr:chemotaxis protein [Burkholderiaceae bacterium]
MLLAFKRRLAAAAPPEPAAAHGADLTRVVEDLAQQASALGLEAAEVRGAIEDASQAAQMQGQAVLALAQQ